MRFNASDHWARGRWKVQIDGEDVGARCYFADDSGGAAGEVGLYLRQAIHGGFYINELTGRPATETRRGRVSLTPQERVEPVGAVLGTAAHGDLPR